MVGQHLVGKGKDTFRVKMVLAVPFSGIGPGEPEIDLVAAAAPGLAQNSVKDSPVIDITIESQALKVIQQSRRLGARITERVIHKPRYRVAFFSRPMTQK